MTYTIEDVKRDLRRLKVNDLDSKTEERLMEMYRRWWRESGIRRRTRLDPFLEGGSGKMRNRTHLARSTSDSLSEH